MLGPITGEFNLFAIDHTNPFYRDELDSSFVETVFKLGTSLTPTANARINLRGDSMDLTFVEHETETAVDLWNLELSDRRPAATTQDRDAWAGHLDARYRFGDDTTSPYVKLRRVLFSGDDPTTNDYEGYDPLFFGWVDWGQWYLGSISSWELFSTNERVSMLEVGAFENLAFTRRRPRSSANPAPERRDHRARRSQRRGSITARRSGATR